MTVYKTVLAPNAPWPMYNKPKVPKVRSKPRETDAKFEAWLLTVKPVSGVKGLKNE